MNKTLIAVGIIFFICVIVGYCRGFIKIAASLAVTVATILLVMFLSPYVSSAILQYTPLEKSVEKYCGSLLQDKERRTREEQISFIEESHLPDLFKEQLLDNNNKEMYTELHATGFNDYIYKKLSTILADMIAYVVTFLVLFVAARIVVYTLGFISDLPIVGGINRLAGGALGFLTALLIVWILMLILTLLYRTSFGKACLLDVADSRILTYLSENNLLMKTILK